MISGSLIMKKKKDNTYKEVLDNLADGVYFVDRERRITYWNKGAERISGFRETQVLGHFCQDNILNHVTENGTQLCLDGCPLHATMADGNPRHAEIYLHHASGHRVPIMIRTNPIRDETGEIVGAVETFSDNSRVMDIRHQVRRLQDVASHDHLTGIGNRLFMEQRLQIAIWEFRQQHIPFGVLFMDIDDFKMFNDTYGHNTGDKVLIMVANTLHDNLRSEDFVARWGGDEFVALLGGQNALGMMTAAKKLSVLVNHSGLRVKGQNIGVSISIGMSLARKEDTVKTILHRADQNMYKSKQAGSGLIAGDEDKSSKRENGKHAA